MARKNGSYANSMALCGLFVFAIFGLGQTLDLSGPAQMGRCETALFTVTLKNDTSQTFSNLIITFVRANADFSYISGSGELTLHDGSSFPAEPQMVELQLIWDVDGTLGYEYELPPGGTLIVSLELSTNCLTVSGTHEASAMGDGFLTSPYDTLSVEIVLPELTVTKTPESQALDCHDPNNTVTWTITVTNTGTAQADWVRVEDTLGASLVYVSSNPPATSMGGGKWSWGFGPLGPGQSVTLELTAYLSRPSESCSASLRTNTASVYWGCGEFDGDPNTADGCQLGGPVNASALVTIPDLYIAPSDIVPVFTCNADGDYSGSVKLTIRNRGDAPTTEDFQLTLSEANTPWSVSGYFHADFGGTLPINPNSSRTITIQGWPVTCEICTYEFTVGLDTADEICECIEGNNTNSSTWTLTLPDVTVRAQNFSISCVGDGQIQIAGTVTLGNEGCGSNLTANVPVRFTLYSGPGCAGEVLDQWVQDFTVDIPAGGEQTFTISPRTVSLDTCTEATGCNPYLLIEADYTQSICECDGENNSLCAELPVDIPDLIVADESLALTCAGEGLVRISGTVTVGNQGCGSTFTGNIPVRFTLRDGSSCAGTVLHAWTEIFSGANIPAGGEQIFTVDHTFPMDLCAAASGCTVSLLIELDYTSSICECNGTNNTRCVDFPVEIPDLSVLSVEPEVSDACTRGTVKVTVANTGCGPVSAGIPVRISGDATGEVFLPPLLSGEESTVSVPLNEILPCGSYNITATVDPDGSLCECTAGNNAVSASFTVVDPDLTVENLALSCNPEGTATVSLTVGNLGTEGSPETTVRLYIDDALAHTWGVPALAVGEEYELVWETPPLKCGQAHQFRVVVDEDDLICECNEGNNEASTTWTCPCPALVTEKGIAEIRRGGIPVAPGTPIQPGDVIRYRLLVTNVGGANAYNVDLYDTLPVEFLYIPGSTSATWPSGSYTSDPAGSPGPDLFWNTSAVLGPNESLVLEFEAVVTSAVVQGQVYTNTMRAIGEEGEGTPIPPDMSGTIPEDTDPDDSDSISHVAAAVPALSVNKEIVDVIRNGVSIWPTERVEPGDLIHYRFTISNVGEGTAYDVDFTDELPPGVEYDTDYADGTYVVDDPPAFGSLGIPDGTTGTIFADISAQIDGGGKLAADFYAYVTSAVQQGIRLVNYATATGKDGYGTPIPPENVQIGDDADDDPDDPDPDDTGHEVIGVAEPALALEKEIIDVLRGGVSVWPTPFVLWGDVIVYRVTVRNVGLGTAYDVDFTDELPFGVAYDTTFGDGTYEVDVPAASGSLGIPDGATDLITADISATIAEGGTLVAVYRVRVTPEAVPGSWLTNNAVVTGRDGAGTPIPEFNPDTADDYPDQDETTIRVGAPALVTDKAYYCPPCDPCAPEPVPCEPCPEEPIPVRVGEIVRFKLTVTNVGYSPAYDIVVEDTLPKGFVYVEKSAVLTWPGGELQLEPVLGENSVLTWVTGLSLDAGESLSIVFSARVTEEASVGEEVVNVMRAEGVDFFHVPIPPDSRMYVPEDTDPEDKAILKLQILPGPSGSVVPPTSARRLAGMALLGLAGFGAFLSALRRSRFLGLSLLLLLAGVGLLAHSQETRYTVTLVSEPPRAGVLFGAGTYKAGELVQISALPNPGFEFVGWFEDGEEVSLAPFYDFLVERDRVLVARFRPVLTFVELGWQSQGRFSFLPTPSLESLRFELRPRFRFGLNSWDFRTVATFSGNIWSDLQFHFTGAWDKARFGGGLFFTPSGPAYRSAYAMFSAPLGDMRLGLRLTHYPSYGTPPGPAVLYNLTLSAAGTYLTARFEEKEALTFKDATLSLYNLSLCCDISLGATLAWAKEEGFSYARFSATNIPLFCCGLSVDLSVTFTAEAKTVEFIPRWLPLCDACFTLYGDVLWNEGRFEGLALYGYRIRCCFGPSCCPAGPGGTVEFLTALDPGRVPGGFREDEFEYLKLVFCGPACCGNYRLEITAFFRPSGALFGFSRLLILGVVPVAPGLTLEPKLEIPVGGDLAFSLGWTWR